jgi:hypothetical protein
MLIPRYRGVDAIEISLPTGEIAALATSSPIVARREDHATSPARGVPTTTRVRTMLDLAPRLTKKRLTRLFNDALREGEVRVGALGDVSNRNPLHPGTKLLARLPTTPPAPPTLPSRTTATATQSI